MVPALRSILLGSTQTDDGRGVLLALALGGFGASFVGYSLGVFAVSGGVVWIPFHAAVVGVIAGCVVGYTRKGLVLGWTVSYTALLGYHAHSAFIGLSRRGFEERLGYFFRGDALGYLAVAGIGLGTLAFTLGLLVWWGRDALGRSDALHAENG